MDEKRVDGDGVVQTFEPETHTAASQKYLSPSMNHFSSLSSERSETTCKNLKRNRSSMGKHANALSWLEYDADLLDNIRSTKRFAETALAGDLAFRVSFLSTTSSQSPACSSLESGNPKFQSRCISDFVSPGGEDFNGNRTEDERTMTMTTTPMSMVSNGATAESMCTSSRECSPSGILPLNYESKHANTMGMKNAAWNPDCSTPTKTWQAHSREVNGCAKMRNSKMKYLDGADIVMTSPSDPSKEMQDLRKRTLLKAVLTKSGTSMSDESGQLRVEAGHKPSWKEGRLHGAQDDYENTIRPCVLNYFQK